MNVEKILSQAVSELEKNKIERLDAEILLAYVLNCNRLKLYTDSEKNLSVDEVQKFQNLIEKRKKNIPVAYLISNKEFFGLNFFVNENVLIPRPDTEILTQFAIENLSGEKNFLDLCTGSGAICISICKFVKNAKCYAVDISENALKVAKFNAEKFGVEDRIKFFCGNLFEPIAEKNFDAIISNPPYIPTKDLKTLQAEVKNEPEIALDGGDDGLNFYREIIEKSPKFLKSGGFLAVEIGINQSEKIINLIAENKNFEDAEIFKDLAGIDRVIAARRK